MDKIEFINVVISLFIGLGIGSGLALVCSFKWILPWLENNG